MQHRLTHLQALRLAAATMIVVHHACLEYTARGGTIDVSLARHVGYFGVDVFFVISGFIMWWTAGHASGAKAAGTFLWRRFTRIFVSYLPVVLFMLFLSVLLDPERLARVNWLASATLFPVPPPQRALEVSWSLTAELIFYALFAVVVASRTKPTTLVVIVAVMLTGVGVVARAPDLPYAFRLLFHPLVIEFFAGIALAMLAQRVSVGRPWPWIVSGIALALLNAAVNMLYLGGFGSEVWRTLTFGSAAAAIVWGVIGLERQGPAPEWAAFMGDASYGLYLLHMPVVYLLLNYLPRFRVDLFSENLELGVAAIVLVSIAASALYLVLIERPLLSLVRGHKAKATSDAAAQPAE